MSIPQRTRELRKAFDEAQLFTLHIPGGKGYSHQLRVANPVKHIPTVMVLVESSRYSMIDGAHEIRLTEIDEMVEVVRKALKND
jgi:hypothetical protein